MTGTLAGLKDFAFAQLAARDGDVVVHATFNGTEASPGPVHIALTMDEARKLQDRLNLILGERDGQAITVRR